MKRSVINCVPGVLVALMATAHFADAPGSGPPEPRLVPTS